MLLSDLPDDILGLISFWLNGFDNCSLWMASDSTFKERLVNNIIREFNVVYVKPARYLWPENFLKKLKRLSRLSLVVDYTLRHLPLEEVVLFPIETLKYLRLRCLNAREILNQKIWISPLYQDHAAAPLIVKTMELDELYPHLEYLYVKSDLGDCPLPIDFLSFLPSSLKYLSIRDFDFQVPEENSSDHMNEIIGRLPRTLTALSLGFTNYDYDILTLDLSKLPPNLTTLFINTMIDTKSYKMMPKDLQVLKLFGSECKLAQLSPFLPTKLRTLSLDTDDSIAEPGSLTHLEHLENLKVKSKQEQSILCPPKLKKFVGFRSRLVDCSQVLSSSHTITVIDLTYVIGLRSEFIAALPQSVTELSISLSQTRPQPFAFFDLLPRKLKLLNCDFDIMEYTSLLPDGLTHLNLRRCLKSVYLDRLPSKLELLNLKAKISPHIILKQLPSTLKHLRIDFTGTDIDDTLFSMLPRGLKELELSTTSSIENNISDESASDLPQNLQTLLLKNNTKMTDDAISKLPRSLTCLEIADNPNFTDKCVEHLPRNLVVLNFNAAAQIGAQSFKNLPRYLRNLHLMTCKEWEPEVFQDLPPYLVIL